jgi:GT2 family glycosyltransferase
LISILIVNWNGKRYVGECLSSIQQQVSQPYEVIIVDNHSADGSANVIAECYPWVKLIRSAENLGFGRGNNLAAKHASGDIFLLLNLDTVLLADPAPIANVLAGDGSIGCIGARMCNGDGKIVANCGHFPSPLRLLLFASIFWRPYKGQYGPADLAAQLSDWVEGSWVMIRRDAWNKIGGFDERIFLYGEDVDLCKCISGLGLKVIQAPVVAYRHYTGWSVHRLPYQFDGFRFYHRKHSAGLERLLAEAALYGGLKVRLIVYAAIGLLTGHERFKLKTQVLRDIDRKWNNAAARGIGEPANEQQRPFIS